MNPNPVFLMSMILVGCSGGAVSSEQEAELAYLGLDRALSRAMDLGFDGFNAASSANIPEQVGSGDESGKMTINGQADQGASDNKGMRLTVALEEYQDLVDVDTDDSSDVSITYWTDPESALPTFDLSLRGIPDGTFEGSFAGTVQMEGDLEGDVVLDVSVAGQLESDGATGTQRAAGTVTVSGTAVGPGGGTYTIDLSL